MNLTDLSDTGKLLFNRATLKIYDRPTLRAVIQGIHDFDLAAHDGHDFKGDMYEYLISRLSSSGTNGQFRTPRHIINLIVELVDPQPGQRIVDPAFGTSGFHIAGRQPPIFIIVYPRLVFLRSGTRYLIRLVFLQFIFPPIG